LIKLTIGRISAQGNRQNQVKEKSSSLIREDFYNEEPIAQAKEEPIAQGLLILHY
jgi:hypothetical protein